MTDTIFTDKFIAEQKKICEKATDGERYLSDNGDGTADLCVGGNVLIQSRYYRSGLWGMEIGPESDYIATACNHFPAALDEIARLREKIERLQRELGRLVYGESHRATEDSDGCGDGEEVS